MSKFQHPKIRLLLFALVVLSSKLSAQDSARAKRNFIKTNLTSLPLRNYSLQYERMLKKSVSASLTLRVMPNGGVPLKNLLLNLGEDDGDDREELEKIRLGNVAITPELRFYTGKRGYGQGFYIALFYRYASFKADGLTASYEETNGTETELAMSGKISANTFGFMLGAQWKLGKSMCLDWWILGPHAGGASWSLDGAANKPLSPQQQDDIRADLEDLDLPFTKDKEITVNSSGASYRVKGPWAGVRAGVSLGVRF